MLAEPAEPDDRGGADDALRAAYGDGPRIAHVAPRRARRHPPPALPRTASFALEPDHEEAFALTRRADPITLRDRTGEPFEMDRRVLSPAVTERTESDWPTRPHSLRTSKSMPLAPPAEADEEDEEETGGLELHACKAWARQRTPTPTGPTRLRRTSPQGTLAARSEAEIVFRARREYDEAAEARREFLHVKSTLVQQLETEPGPAAARLGELYLVAARAASGGDDADLQRAPKALGQAIEWLRRAADCEPDRAEPLYLLGRAFDQAGMRADARRAYHRAVDLDPARSRYWCSLGVLHCADEAYPEAQTVFERAAEAAAERLEALCDVDIDEFGERVLDDGHETESQARSDQATAQSNLAQLWLHFGAHLGINEEVERLERAGTAFELAARHAPTPESQHTNAQRLEAVRRRTFELREAMISNAPPVPGTEETDATETSTSTALADTSPPTTDQSAEEPQQAAAPAPHRPEDGPILAVLQQQLEATGRLIEAVERMGADIARSRQEASRREDEAIRRESERDETAALRHAELIAAIAAQSAAGPARPALVSHTPVSAVPAAPSPLGAVMGNVTTGSIEDRVYALADLGSRYLHRLVLSDNP